MKNLTGKCVLLGITGGIAAYKMANVASALHKAGAKVHVIMTENATKFITPLTFETLTNSKCMVDTFDREFEFDVRHISVAKEADVILMAKKGTDGIYDSDPNKNADAKKFDTLSYIEIINRGLQVMDTTATSLCMDNKIPLVVFNIDEHKNIVKAALGEEIGTTVGGNE